MIGLDTFLAMAAFVLVMSATPGPNTMLLLASGVNFGFQRTLPHMAGITVGFAIMLGAVGLGIGTAFAAAPGLQMAMKVASVAYMLWFAWRIATAGPVGDKANARGGRPFTFLEAAGFQWINPKAWAIALSGSATYLSGSSPLGSLLVLIALFVLLNPPIAAAWTAFGVGLRRLLEHPGRLRAFNLTMALALIASLWPVVKDLL